MRRIATTLVLLAMVAGGTPALAQRDLGLHRLHGTIDLIWTAIEADGRGAWTGSYAIRGQLGEAEDGDEALLAGWSLHCDGVMSGVDLSVTDDAGTCRFESGSGSRIQARYAGGDGSWSRSTLRIGFHGGTGIYRTLHGEGTIVRLMHLPHLPHRAPVGWGFLIGAISWHRG
jgi:hypothetical protein